MMIRNLWITKAMIPQISKLTGRHPTTIARWINHREIPPLILDFLELALGGDLGVIHNDWKGWHINQKTGEMVTPLIKHRTTTPGLIMLEQLRYQQISALQIQVKDLKAKCAKQDETIRHLAIAGVAASIGQSRTTESAANT